LKGKSKVFDDEIYPIGSGGNPIWEVIDKKEGDVVEIRLSPKTSEEIKSIEIDKDAIPILIGILSRIARKSKK
jgi:hypothetical protein